MALKKKTLVFGIMWSRAGGRFETTEKEPSPVLCYITVIELGGKTLLIYYIINDSELALVIAVSSLIPLIVFFVFSVLFFRRSLRALTNNYLFLYAILSFITPLMFNVWISFFLAPVMIFIIRNYYEKNSVKDMLEKLTISKDDYSKYMNSVLRITTLSTVGFLIGIIVRLCIVNY